MEHTEIIDCPRILVSTLRGHFAFVFVNSFSGGCYVSPPLNDWRSNLDHSLHNKVGQSRESCQGSPPPRVGWGGGEGVVIRPVIVSSDRPELSQPATYVFVGYC